MKMHEKNTIEHENYVDGTPVGSEAALAFREIVFCNSRYQPVEEYSCQDLSCDGEESYPLRFEQSDFSPLFL